MRTKESKEPGKVGSKEWKKSKEQRGQGCQTKEEACSERGWKWIMDRRAVVEAWLNERNVYDLRRKSLKGVVFVKCILFINPK